MTSEQRRLYKSIKILIHSPKYYELSSRTSSFTIQAHINYKNKMLYTLLFLYSRINGWSQEHSSVRIL